MPKLTPEQVARLDPFGVRGRSASEKLEKLLEETTPQEDVSVGVSQEPIDDKLKFNVDTFEYVRGQILLGNEEVIEAVLPELEELRRKLRHGSSYSPDFRVAIFRDQLQYSYPGDAQIEKGSSRVRQVALDYANDLIYWGNRYKDSETLDLIDKAIEEGHRDVIEKQLSNLIGHAKREYFDEGSMSIWARKILARELDQPTPELVEEGGIGRFLLRQEALSYANWLMDKFYTHMVGGNPPVYGYLKPGFDPITFGAIENAVVRSYSDVIEALLPVLGKLVGLGGLIGTDSVFWQVTDSARKLFKLSLSGNLDGFSDDVQEKIRQIALDLQRRGYLD